jgi:hypothetical protein
MNMPVVLADEIEKCPAYLSEEICGHAPSHGYLMEIFNRSIEAKRPYFDSEVVNRMCTLDCLAVDASYKVPKLMMKWGDNKLYDALQTGMNEYSECILQHFCSCDSHRQLVPVLRHLHPLGLDPSFAFTDNPRRDTEFLEREFNGLKGDPDEVTNNWRIDESNTIPLHGGILYANTYQEATDGLLLIFC